MINILGEDQLKPPVKDVYIVMKKNFRQFQNTYHKDNLDTRCEECKNK